MKTYFVDMDMPNRHFRSVCLQAADDKNSRIVVPNEKAKEAVEGLFWVNKIRPLTTVVIDKSKFLTGEDIYHAMWDERTEVTKDEWSTLPPHTQTIYINVAANLVKRMNEKGGW